MVLMVRRSRSITIHQGYGARSGKSPEDLPLHAVRRWPHTVDSRNIVSCGWFARRFLGASRALESSHQGAAGDGPDVRAGGWVTPSGLIRALKSPLGGVTTTGARGSALPPDLLRDAARRLGLIAGAFTALSLVVLTLGHTLFPTISYPWPTAMDWIV